MNTTSPFYISLSKGICIPKVCFLYTFCLLALVMLCTPQALSAQELARQETDMEESLDWSLNADKIISLPGNTIIEATGNVLFTRGTDTLKADFARYFSDTKWVYLEGAVLVNMGNDTLQATSAEFDLESKTGWLKDGHVFMEGPHVYFSGSQMVKHAGDQYTFHNAYITTCDGDNPAWSVQADSAIVEIDGYAQLYRSNVKVKDQALIYSPYLILPAKTSRQSGFILPDYGYSTKRGVYYTQPYYHVIDESSDITVYATVMTEIGPMLGIEYRSQPLSTQKTWLMASVGYDRKSVDSPSEDDVYTENPALRTNNTRYWLRGMADGMIGSSEWRYRSTIDYVSDQNYLREFEEAMFGFDDSRTALFDIFGRDLNDYNEKRLSAINIYKDWERLSFIASTQYTQDPSLGHGNRRLSNDETVQRFPQFDLFFNKSRLFPELPLELEAHLQTAYFHRAEGTSGLRTEIIPRLSIPLNLKRLSLIGSVGLRQTIYNTDEVGATSPLAPYANTANSPRQTGDSRNLIDYSLKAFTEANRIWKLTASPLPATKENIGKTTWTAVRHDMQPRAEYLYTHRKYQADNPFYTTNDRILSKNELIYSLTNIITRKGRRISIAASDSNTDKGIGKNTKDIQPLAETVYEELLRIRFLSGYDFAEEDRTHLTDEYELRPFMDIRTDIDFYLNTWATLSGKIFLSPYDAEITRLDYGFSFNYLSWTSFYTGLSQRTEDYDIRRQLRYDNPREIQVASPENLMHNRLTLDLTSEWSISLEDYRDMRRGGSLGKSYEQTFSINFEAQCYRLIAAYRYDGYDKSFTFMVEIPGIFE